jgi:hypothetical protein
LESGTGRLLLVEIEAHDLPVIGTLPPELTGLYLRNGPNPPSGSDPRFFFAGNGMVHGVAGTAYLRPKRRPGIRALKIPSNCYLWWNDARRDSARS